MRVLVTGGAGYIGSHTVVQLIEDGHEAVIVDDHSNSRPEVLARIERITGTRPELRVVDIARDAEGLGKVLADTQPDAVIHFAAFKSVPESVERPLDYYENNLGGLINLLRHMDRHGIRQLIFSSSASVYGAETPPGPLEPPYVEEMPTGAVSPYGWTKVMCEQILRDVATPSSPWRVALLRYFNPVGCHPSGLMGEDPEGLPSSLLPVISQVAIGMREHLAVFGTDYDTVDGTCIRDYIHVDDLASGHLAALRHLEQTSPGTHTWNLGTGHGTSVLELVHVFEETNGVVVPLVNQPRREGDIPVAYADPSRAQRELGWRATRSISDSCRDQWIWQKNISSS